eukprot:jgi/Phyca11/18636/fgenesh1_pg.PHYCAscaffold_38_\
MVKSIKHKPICQHHLSGKNETTRKQEDYPTSKLQQSEQQQQQLERQNLKKKYGRRDNMFKIQQKLASRKQQPGERLSDYAAVLMDIGFGQPRLEEEALLFALDEFSEGEEQKKSPAEEAGETTRVIRRRVHTNARWRQLSRVNDAREPYGDSGLL